MNNTHRINNNINKKETFDIIRKLFHYFFEYAVTSDDKGKQVLNNKMIKIAEKEIIIDIFLFDHDWDLLIKLLKIPVPTRVGIVQAAVGLILAFIMTDKTRVDLSDKGVCLLT